MRGGSEKAAGIGAVAAAAFASMCCILPVGLGALGVSGVVLSALFEPLRPYFLALSGALLALGFYLSFRTPAQGEACATNASKVARASRPTLFIAALATAALALFPSISGFASGGAGSLAPQVDSSLIVLAIDGMTCESCVPAVRVHLLDVPGVIDAAVSYERKVALIRVREERAPAVSLLVEAVEKAGYAARVEAR